MQAIIPRRVKVYILNGEDWIDNGTGYCTGEIDDKNNIPFFIVRNELDESDIILKAFIEGTTQYQQQQETLIVWTDELGRDIALSFQEPNGCTSLCDFLIDVFQNYQPHISLVAVISNNGEGDITELIVGPVEYPPLPTMKNLSAIVECLNAGASSNYSKDQISAYLLEHDYIAQLIELFEKCEANKRLNNLHHLCDIMKILILYSNTQIIEILLNDNNIMGVVGILEYDPEFPTYKSNHREYLTDESKFKEVIPIDDVKIKNKIKSTFRLQFLKDVVLAKLLDDATFNLIQTLIYFHQVDVIKFLQESNGYMEKLFNMYEETNSNDDDVERKRDGVRMLHQFAIIAKTLQGKQRSAFFKSLVSKGLFKMINFSLKDESTSVRVLCTELIVSIIEHDALLIHNEYGNGGEEYMISSDMTLMVLLTRLLIDEKDIGLKTQAFEAIKVLLDPLNSSNSHNGHQQGHQLQRHVDTLDDEVNDDDWFEKDPDAYIDIYAHIENFYSDVAPQLFEPLIKLAKLQLAANGKTLSMKELQEIIDINSINECILFQHLCELVRFCSVTHEKAVSRSFFLENDIIIGLKNLTHNSFKMQLRLSAIRSIKAIIALDDEFYTRFIIVNDVLEYIVQFDLTSNTLASSTVLSIIEIDDINKETDERKKHYDAIMSYINKLIKFEEDELIEETAEEVSRDGDAKSPDKEPADEKREEQQEEQPSKQNGQPQSTDDIFHNKLKREISSSSSSSMKTASKSKKIKWVKKLFNKK